MKITLEISMSNNFVAKLSSIGATVQISNLYST